MYIMYFVLTSLSFVNILQLKKKTHLEEATLELVLSSMLPHVLFRL